MSYEQLAASVDALSEANTKLTNQVLVTQASSNAAVAAAESEVAKAQQAADAAQLSAKVYATAAEGLAATAVSGYFNVVASDNKEFLILYKNNAGAAVEIKRYPSSNAVGYVIDRLAEDATAIFAVVDSSGSAGLLIKHDLIKTSDIELSVDRIQMGDQSVTRSDEAAFTIIDEFGFVGLVVPNTGIEPTTEHVVGFSVDDVLKENQIALASSANVVREYNTEVARPIWQYNHFIQDGQSLSTDFEGYPALSKTPRLGNMMLGNSPRPASRANPDYIPLGVSTLTPMKSVVQDSSTGGTILSDAQVAALPAGSSNEGESSIVSMTNFAKALHNQRLQVANDDTRTFIGSSCGVNGQTIEQLSKGNATNRWQRLVQAAEKVKAISVTDGKTYGIVSVSFLQGEFNYSTAWGGVATLSEYKDKMNIFYNDIETDIVAGISGQTQPPLFLTYQTGASYTNDANNLAIGMAQWELSKERRNWVLATPVYPYPDKGGHLTANSYRWIGKQFAKVWHRVVELGQDWKPLSPISASTKDREAIITFHVPHPPLKFDTPYVGRTATTYVNKGFTSFDSTGSLAISSVEIAADCVVRLKFSRSPVGQVFIRYGDKTVHNGNGCLRDSDPTISDDVYEYNAGSGQYADENIPELVGKPYPLYNWSIAFNIPAVEVV